MARCKSFFLKNKRYISVIGGCKMALWIRTLAINPEAINPLLAPTGGKKKTNS